MQCKDCMTLDSVAPAIFLFFFDKLLQFSFNSIFVGTYEYTGISNWSTSYNYYYMADA